MGRVGIYDIEVAVYIFGVVILFTCIYALWIWFDEKSKVSKMPKEPMNLCDKHGLYPSRHSMWITAPQEGKGDLKVEICPQCYAERLKIVKEKLKL